MDATEKLFFACQNGILDDVKTQLKEVCVNAQDAEGVTPLQVAAANGYEEVAYLLLSSKAEIDLANSSGWTPLMLSARYGHTAVVSLLIKNGARVNVCNKLGVQPLTAAARSGHLPTFRLLLEAGADPVIRHSAPVDGSSYMYGSGDMTPLMTAALYGHDPIVKLLIEWKVDVNQATPVTGLTPLMMAAWSGHKQTSQILLECGADPNMTNLGDKTALDIATLRGKREVKAYLDDKTVARTTEYVEKSEADIIEAVKKGNSKWLEQLLKEDPGLSNWCQDDDGATPLMYAAMLGHLDIVKLLINHGADLNKQETKRGWTALMQAVVYERTAVVHYLLDAGANAYVPNCDGLTALDLASLVGLSDQEVRNKMTNKPLAFRRLVNNKNSSKSWILQMTHRLPILRLNRNWNTSAEPNSFDVRTTDPALSPTVFFPLEDMEKIDLKSPGVKKISLSSFVSPRRAQALAGPDTIDPVIPPLLPSPLSDSEACIMPGIKITSGKRPKPFPPPVNLLKHLPNRTASCYYKSSFNDKSSSNLCPMDSSSSGTSNNSQVAAVYSSNEIVNQLNGKRESKITMNNPGRDGSSSTKDNSNLFEESTEGSKTLVQSMHLGEEGKKPMTEAEKNDLANLLQDLDMEKYLHKFESHEVDMEAFQELKAEDLRDLNIQTVANQEKLLKVIESLQQKRC